MVNNLLMQKQKHLEVSLEEFGKLIFSYLEYPIFLPIPQLLNLIHLNSKILDQSHKTY